MVKEHQSEINLLQLLAHHQNSEWFSVSSVNIFEVNSVAEQKDATGKYFLVFQKLPLPSVLLLPPLPFRYSDVPAYNCGLHLSLTC